MAKGAGLEVDGTTHPTHPNPAGVEDPTSSDFPLPVGNLPPGNVIDTTDNGRQGSHFFPGGAILGA